LGNGTTTNRSTPVQVMNGVQAISAGGAHSLFLKIDGSVWASGYNSSGQLGYGTTTNRSTPMPVLNGVQAISANSSHSLFLKIDGTVWASGANWSGQLGDGTTTQSSTPVQVLSGVQAISAGTDHSLFLKTDGTVWASGNNYSRQLGDGTTTNRSTPIQTGPATPTITEQPQSVTVVSGASVTFTVVVTGTSSPTYQWQKNGVNISGATSSSLTLTSAQTSDAGNYQCVISNSFGSVTSATSVLTVYTDTSLTIRNQPTAQVVTLGTAATFSLTATSVEPISYQWRKNGVAISGATAASYTIPAVTTNDAGNYSCIVSDYDELLFSASVSLTTQVLPAITSQPTSRTVLQGASTSFTVAATGTPAPTYQWHLNGVAISGATSTTYTLASAQADNAGSYTCIVSNPAGSVTSSTATLTVNVPATVATPPSNVTVFAGDTATFTVSATGTPTLSYQWMKNGNLLTGATSSSLALTDVRYLDEADYSCVITNTYGATESAAATLSVTVNPASPDSDGDGLSDSLETYLSCFGLNPAENSTNEWARLLAMIPDLGTYYTADQMRGLALGQPDLKRAANGNYLLTFRLLESSDLSNWTGRTLLPANITIIDGSIQVELPPLAVPTWFYRVHTLSTP
jgi:alpha-tubulin suppressor-like RCC1 family protein